MFNSGDLTASQGLVYCCHYSGRSKRCICVQNAPDVASVYKKLPAIFFQAGLGGEEMERRNKIVTKRVAHTIHGDADTSIGDVRS